MGLFDEEDDITYTISSAKHDEIVRDCFNQKRPRVCGTCPAHPDNGGQCCFGDPSKLDSTDPECSECVFNYECEQEVIDAEAEAQYQYKTQTAPSRFRKSRLRVLNNESQVPTRHRVGRKGVRRERPLLTNADDQVQRGVPQKVVDAREETEEETMFQRFIKDVLWGALQGAFEMALSFLRHHRLP